jgi:hypothetical protein
LEARITKQLFTGSQRAPALELEEKEKVRQGDEKSPIFYMRLF